MCAGREFEGIDVGTWDGVASGVFYRLRCLNCHAVWVAYPSHEALNADEPLKWQVDVTHNSTLRRTEGEEKRSWLKRFFGRG